MSGSDFIVHLNDVPLTRTTNLQLQKFAKASSMSEEAAAGYAIERFMNDQGELEIRLAKARDTAEKDRKANGGQD